MTPPGVTAETSNAIVAAVTVDAIKTSTAMHEEAIVGQPMAEEHD